MHVARTGTHDTIVYMLYNKNSEMKSRSFYLSVSFPKEHRGGVSEAKNFSYALRVTLLFTIRNIEIVRRSFEIFFCKLSHIFGFIRRATKYIQVDRTACIREVGGDQGGLDQLRHTE